MDDRYEDDPPGGGETDDGEEASSLREVIITVAAALLLAYLVQGFVIKPYRIPSGSMEHTLRCGDRVLVDRVTYHVADPKRGQIVVFHPPGGLDESGTADTSVVESGGEELFSPEVRKRRTIKPADVNYIKRIVGLPGDTVEMHRGRTFIDGKRLPEPYLHPQRDRREFGPVTVPAGTYLMMGDNRSNSADGREFGPVPRSFVVGRAFTIYWPIDRIGLIPKRETGGPDAGAPDPRCGLEGAAVPAASSGALHV